MSLKVVLSTLLILGISACASYPVPRYSVSAKNVQAFKRLKSRVAVKPFEWTYEGSHDSFKCRAAGPIETSENVKFENYVQKAIEDELQLAEALDEKGIPLKIVFSEMDVKTTSPAHWKIAGNVTFGKSKFTHTSSTKFEGAFFADNACKGGANSFIAAVQDFTASLIPKLASSVKAPSAR